MTKLSDLFDPDLFSGMLYNGYVRRNIHPSAPLAILNYSEKAAFDREWNPVTLACRGLIYNTETDGVVARPWRKFFNYGEPGCPEGLLDSGEPVSVTDKKDGSLAISFLNPVTDAYEIATRGSFTSDQALHATALLHEKYSYAWEPGISGTTYLWEVLYKANRIVVDYGDFDDLVLLGAVDIETGKSYTARFASRFCWPGPVAEEFPAKTLKEALELKPRPNAEGVVVHFLHSDQRVKIKQADYLQAHAIVTRTSAKALWETLSRGDDLSDFLELVPGEFATWAQKTANQLRMAKIRWATEAVAEYGRMPRHGDRKTFALEAVKSDYRSALFRLYDGHSIEDLAWKAVRPDYERPWFREADESA